MKKGTKIIAIDPCVMDEAGEQALIVGNTYKIQFVKGDSFFIKSEIHDNHEFEFRDYLDFFELAHEKINEAFLLRIGFEKVNWEHNGEKFHEFQWTNRNTFHLDVGSNMKVELFETEVPNCKTITDLKHLIRILGLCQK